MNRAIELVPITEHNSSELAGVAHDLHNLVSTPEVAHSLEARHLYGVTAASTSLAALERAAERMEEGLRARFTIHDTSVGRAIGQATIMPRTKLRRQRTTLPPAIDTRLGWLAGCPQDMNVLGVNVVAWADPREPEDHIEVLTQAYKFLREAVDGSVWTIEPVAMHFKGFGRVMLGASYTQYDPGFYDDQKSRRHSVGRSFLYRGNVQADR